MSPLNPIADDEQYTSAQLRQAERERDEACALSVELLRDTDRLRQVEAENEHLRGDFVRLRASLAASQADLTRVERERDEALAAQARIGDRLTETVVRLTAYRRDRELLRAELASARKELDLLRAGRPADQQTEKSMTMNMTPEEHFARGLEFLALADNAPAMSAEDLAVAQTRAVVAHAHFGAAAAGTAMRAFAATDPAEKHEQSAAGVDDNLRAAWLQDGDPAAHRYVNDGAYCCTACGEHATARWHLIEAPDA